MNPLTWTPLTVDGINKSGSGHFSGRVTDVLTFENCVVISTAFGGVWAINRSIPILSGFQTTCLTDAWDDPNVTCLANGPDGERQVYAGCSRTLTYFELADAVGGPQTPVVVNLPLPVADPKTVFRVVVDVAHRRIVIATGTGVWWSAIPANPGTVSAYSWQPATGLPGARVSGLCLAKGGSVHAALWGDGTSGSTNFGIFRGTFSASGLTFARSSMQWLDSKPTDQVSRISLASCDGNRDVAFASCSFPDAPDHTFRGILQYNATTDTWNDILNQTHFASLTSDQMPGHQGTFNNCIAVAPDDSSLVAFGWQNGTFIRRSGTWSLLTNAATHHDMHGLRFVVAAPGERTLFVGGDGGILQVDHPAHATPNFDDRLNAFLPDLLFSHVLRNQYATMDASRQVDGLVSGGLQDNGVKYLKTTPQAYASWLQIEGADGGTNVFLTNGVLICREFNKSSRFRGVRWNTSANDFDPSFAIQNDVTVTDDPRMDVCSRVITPAHQNAKRELMHAVSAGVLAAPAQGLPKNQNVAFGLFGDAALTSGHWSIIGKTTPAVTAIGSMTGDVVILGLADGSIASLDTTSQALTAQALPAGVSGGTVLQFEVVSGSLVFALYAIGKTDARLLVYDGHAWQVIPLPVAEIVYSIAVNWTAKTIYIATDTSVYQGVQRPIVTGPGGPVGFNTSFAWMNSSAGLPARPHGSHLRLGLEAGETYLYLATYGRSVYRAAVTTPAPQQPGAGAKAGVKILFGVVQDGGGLEFDPATGKLIIVPPRQPVEATLGDLFVSETLRGSTAKTDVTVRRAALQRVSDFVRQELDAVR